VVPTLSTRTARHKEMIWEVLFQESGDGQATGNLGEVAGPWAPSVEDMA
jgi:hypothetical protein